MMPASAIKGRALLWSLIVFTCGLTAQGARTQPIPDTLDWRRYFPLEVENQWQYRSDDHGFVFYTRWHIRADTLIEEQTFFVIEISGYDADLRPLEQMRRTDFIRYDTTNALILRRAVDQAGEAVEVWWLDIPCGMDASFNAWHECTGPDSRGMDYFVDGEYDTSIVVGTDTVPTAAAKSFNSLGGGWTLAADIGLVGGGFDGGAATGLVYAQLGDRRFGTPAVSTSFEHEPGISSGFGIISVYPNPVTSTTTISYRVQVPGSLSVEVYNGLGQRVRTHLQQPGSPGEYYTVIDFSGLSAGQYFVRLIAAGGHDTRALTLIK
jgi:hypothetical protein